ncbi:MAG: LCP family protein [Brevefilum sp.]|nr:LCP family protein [Brevefilum sp.]
MEERDIGTTETEIDANGTDNKKNRTIILGILGGLIIICTLLYFFLIRPMLRKPISEPLGLPTIATTQVSASSEEGGEDPLPVQPPSNLTEIPVFIPPPVEPDVKPVCGQDAEWMVLMVGIDYLGDGFLYGLADVIRVIRVDFVNMTVNMIALPRDLIVEAPEGRFRNPDPYKINQAYLFGTPGWDGYLGSGQGAGALAEVIQYNFGIPIDHYGVINYLTFINFIDAIGGVEVNLSGPIDGGFLGDFPSGKQTLNGERALALARIRYGYGDAFRVRNQTLIMRAVLNKMIQPANLVKVPTLLNQFSGAFLTDLSVQQLGNLGGCFLRNFDTQNLQTFEPPSELLTGGSAFIPTLNNNAFVYHWDQELVEWMYESLLGD